MKFLCALCVLCSLALPARALDREAFTFTSYDLNVRVEPEQQRLGVRGRITLHNDSQSPQKNLSLQISSTLRWSSIQFEGKPVEFASQAYTSDIDHTGALTEAIVTLPRAIAPKAAARMRARIIPSATTKTGSNTPWLGAMMAAGCGSATARCTSNRCPTRSRLSRQANECTEATYRAAHRVARRPDRRSSIGPVSARH